MLSKVGVTGFQRLGLLAFKGLGCKLSKIRVTRFQILVNSQEEVITWRIFCIEALVLYGKTDCFEKKKSTNIHEIRRETNHLCGSLL